MNAPAQQRLGSSQPADFVCQHVHQFGLRLWTAVGQGALQVIPDAFIRVQLGGVRGQGFHVQTGRPGEQLLDRITAMNLAIIQQHDQMAVHLPQQMAEEDGHFFTVDIVLIQVAVQRTMATFRADGDTRNGRDPVVPIPMMNNRRLSDRAPRFAHRRNQEEARFVNKDKVGCQPCGVFFTRGQTDRVHSAMAVSLRSMARRSGFWWLHPIWWRSLPT